MQSLAPLAAILLAVSGVMLVGGFFLLSPVMRAIRRRTDALLMVDLPERAANGMSSAGTITTVLRRFIAAGLTRQWGISSSAAVLVVLGGLSGFAGWFLSHMILHFPLWLTLLIVVPAFWITPHMLARMEQARADRSFLDFFPDTIDMIVRMLRAGLPINTAIRVTSREAPAPINAVFASLADQIDIGVDFKDALAVVGKQIALPDFQFFVAAIALQRTTGGKLGTTLEVLGEIIRRRRIVRLKARAATAEVRLSAYILGALPFLIIAGLLVASPSYFMTMALDPRGKTILAIAGFMLLLAFATMRQMMRSVLKP